MIRVRDLYKDLAKYDSKEVVLKGWLRNNRSQKEFGFIDLNDGSCFETTQVVYGIALENFKEIQKYRAGSGLEIKGKVLVTPNNKQPFEIQALEVKLLADSAEDYPIQPKRHTKEFLRVHAHLRPRTNLFSAVFRVRSLAAHAIHSFFQEQDFIYCHTPLITGNDGEGAGEMFKVTTLDMDNLPRTDKNEIDYKKDFFAKKVGLTVTGQLEAEAFAQSMRATYTFGPTFRAENSNTQRHASEFWMIEPEVAFNELADNMKLAEDMLKYVISYLLEKAPSEMTFFNKFVEKGLIEKLTKIVECDKFKELTHKEAITLLLESGEKFANLPKYDDDLSTEHEKFLTKHFNGPVFVKDWPKEFKAFYMRLNDDNETVAAMDLIVPGSGELIGGSQREERLDVLLKRMKELDIEEADLDWYLDLRRFGGVKTSGFGLGFERLIMYVTGVDNIRDVVPFPRTPKNASF
ncbi:MAG: asparagine--tRNA ligase [Psychrilyobacter sp.]|nr:asparagine--tRNA ligase [Psychrilyobacter sp.]